MNVILIYTELPSKPIGVLDALVEMKSNLDNVIIFNSLSKGVTCLV